MGLGHDLRLVFRGFRQTPAPAILIVLTLGLAIGANSATYSLIDRVALRPLPVEKPYEIVMVNALGLPYYLPGGSVTSNAGKVRGMPYPLFQSLRDGLTSSFSAMAAFRGFRLTVSAEPSALEIVGEGVTADYFRVLGLHPLVGRTFTAVEEGQRDGPAIAILNHGFWLRQFGGDRTVLNRTIRLNNVPFTVVGVLAPGYLGMFTWSRPDVFVPVALGDQLRPPPRQSQAWVWDGMSNRSYFTVARLAPGVTREAAERELQVYYQRLWDDVVRARHVTVPAKDMDVYRRRPPEVMPAGTVGSTQSGTPHSYEVPLRLLFAMAVFVLFVAAGNVANLLAASGARRGREMAVSLALGARRWDLLRPSMVRRLDRGVALTAFGSLGALARDALLRDRMLAGLSQVFAALAGLLAAMGLAGLTSVNVTRRTREIGVRLALGASRGSVQRLMLRDVVVLIGGGTAAGLVLFLSANRVLRSMLFEISADDPVTIAWAIAALAAIGVLAGWLPARRAAQVDPAVTLRSE